MNRIHHIKQQRAYVLITVVVTLFIVAAIALLLNRESAIGVNSAGREAQSDQAAYVAEAGYRHALWQTNNSNCTAYPNPLTANFGAHSYNVNVTPTSGSPVSISASGNLADGTSRNINQNRVPVYEAPTTVTLQLGTDPGKDARPDSFYNLRNYGVNYASVRGDPAWYQHQLVQFDVSALPAGVKVLSARLEFYQIGAGSLTADSKVTAHRLTQDWVEGTKSGTGTPDGATWETYDGSGNWATFGGDFDPNIVASSAVTTGNKWVGWEIGGLVENWLTGSVSNQGVLLQANGNFFVDFEPSEAATASLRPKLTITYACECGKSCSGVACSDGNYRDEFNVDAFNNSDGTLSWAGDWIERDSAGTGPASGKVVITGSELRLNGTPASSEDPSLAREIDLSGHQSATLSFNYRTGSGVEAAEDSVVVEVSDNGGTSWTVLEDFINEVANASGSRSYDISTYIATNTQVRFRINAAYGGPSEYFYVDNLEIAASCSASPPSGGKLLMVVADPANLSAEDLAKKTLMEGWSFTVNLIDDSDLQSAFDTAVTANDVAFVAESVVASELASKLKGASIGVVNEEPGLHSVFGFSTNRYLFEDNPPITTDSGHYITSPFSGGNITLFSSVQPLGAAVGTLHSGRTTIGTWTSGPASPLGGLLTLNTGAVISGGGTASGRRVQMPWGGSDGGTVTNISNLTADGLTILKRAIEWGAEPTGGPGSGSGTIATLAPTQDTFVGGDSTAVYGSNVSLFLGFGSREWRPLMQFDISSIPAGSTILSATLRLHNWDDGSGTAGPLTVKAHRVTEAWTAKWGNKGANWYDRVKQGGGALPWATAGVSYDVAWSADATFDSTAAPQWVDWNISPLVQEWVDTIKPNYGVVLVPVAGSAWANARSSDFADSNVHPQLVVEYTPP